MQYNIDVEIYTCIKIIIENEREKEKRFQVYHNHRSSGSDGVVPFPAETGRAVYYSHSYRWRVQALGRGECEQMDDRKQRAVCRKVLKMVDENTFQKVHFSEDLEEPHCIIFRVYLMPYHSNWAFEVYCRKQKKDTHRWEIRVRENHL